MAKKKTKIPPAVLVLRLDGQYSTGERWDDDIRLARHYDDLRTAETDLMSYEADGFSGTYEIVANADTGAEVVLFTHVKGHEQCGAPMKTNPGWSTCDVEKLGQLMVSGGYSDYDVKSLFDVFAEAGRAAQLGAILEKCRDIGPCYCDWSNNIVCPCAQLRSDIERVLGKKKDTKEA